MPAFLHGVEGGLVCVEVHVQVCNRRETPRWSESVGEPVLAGCSSTLTGCGLAVRQVSAKRAARSAGGRLLRRLGALPGGAADGLGQDGELLGTRLAQRVIVYFPEPPENLYQLRQWYEPLAALDARQSVVVVTQDSRVTRVVRAETAFPVVCIARSATLDDLLSRSDVRLMLYVSHSPANFPALRTLGVAHAYLTHGDSDKLVSVSNQMKAYDVTLVAGQAAIDRAAKHLLWFDAKARMIPVGRPQLDSLAAASSPSRRNDSGAAAKQTVLYAPTWEGAQPSTAYSSLVSMGPQLASSILRDGALKLIYRPHPRTGSRSGEYANADRSVRSLIKAARREPGSVHRIDTTGSPIASMAAADLLLCDVSAMALDWLITGRPLVVTVPSEPGAKVSDTRLWHVVTRLELREVLEAPALIAKEIAEDPGHDQRRALATYYLGDSTPGASMKRFLDACETLIARRDAAVAEQLAT